jgi:ubiquinone/menaquinone biosynthesis C-methylase UbiE
MTAWAKKRKVMHRYDLTAQMYDMRYENEQKAKIKTALENIKTERLGSVLDVGCGTGILFEDVDERADTILAIDVSRNTLIRAKERQQTTEKATVHLVRADADNMPLKNRAFNSIFAVTVLQNVPDPKKTLKEMKRTAKDNAVFVVTGLKKVFTRKRFQQILKDAHLKVQTMEDDDLKCYVAVCVNG